MLSLARFEVFAVV